MDEQVATHEVLDPWGTEYARVSKFSGLAVDGLRLISDALAHVPRLLGVAPEDHIRGPELCTAVARYAEEVFEAEAFDALAEWGLATGQDVGRGVAALIEAGLMEESEQDSPDDFAGVGPLRHFVGSTPPAAR